MSKIKEKGGFVLDRYECARGGIEKLGYVSETYGWYYEGTTLFYQIRNYLHHLCSYILYILYIRTPSLFIKRGLYYDIKEGSNFLYPAVGDPRHAVYAKGYITLPECVLAERRRDRLLQKKKK